MEEVEPDVDQDTRLDCLPSPLSSSFAPHLLSSGLYIFPNPWPYGCIFPRSRGNDSTGAASSVLASGNVQSWLAKVKES